jgi:hypothetical protein
VVRVALRMYPAQREWFKKQVFDEFAKAQGCKVEIVEFMSTEELNRMLENGEADLAKVDIEHAPVLVERGLLRQLPAGEHVDPQSFDELVKSLRPEAVQLGKFDTMTGNHLYLLPRKLETGQFAFRPSLVKIALAEAARQQPELETRLRALLGHGLPEGFVLNPDVGKWTYWDLLVASWTWAHTSIGGRVEPRYALRAEKRVLMEAIAAGAPVHEPWHVSPAMVDLFYAYSVMRELDVLHPETFHPLDYQKARDMLATRGLAAFIEVQIDVGILVGNGKGLPRLIDNAADVDVAPLPRLVDLSRAEDVPVAAEPASEVWGWGWGVPRTSHEPDLAMRLIMNILSKDRHTAELEEFPILRVRSDATPEWPLARRLNQVGDEQLANGRARFVEWPKHPGEIEQIEMRIERAFRNIVVERRYHTSKAHIDRAEIERRLKGILDAEP